jgi:hypothetical protein
MRVLAPPHGDFTDVVPDFIAVVTSRAANALRPQSFRNVCPDVALALWAGWHTVAVMAPAMNRLIASSSRRVRIAMAAAVLIASGALAGLACGGTTGHEGLPTPDAGQDVTVEPDARSSTLESGAFDVAIVYTDRVLPDVEIADTGPNGADEATTGDSATGGLAPCTEQNPTNCVQCQFNIADGGDAAGFCTPTEADFVAFDIANGLATAPGPDPGPPDADAAMPTGSCYYCLFQGGCIDDAVFADMGNECEDGDFVGAGGTTVAECETVIHCILGSSCARVAVSGCYCGDAGIDTTCQGNPAAGPINGACASQIATGLGFQLADGTDNTMNLTDTKKGGGRATQIFQCAQSNHCTACLQK